MLSTTFKPAFHTAVFDQNPAEALEAGGDVMLFGRGAEIVAQGDPVVYGYRIVAGCVRSVRLLDDGRRQIGDFLMPDDIFGWECINEHEFSAEAVGTVRVRRFNLHGLSDRASQDSQLSSAIVHRLAAQIRRAQQHVVLLGRTTAAERIAKFLLDMSRRLPVGRDHTIALPMGRVDIADYLGMTIETVCRRLTELQRSGMIAVDRSKIAILRPSALASHCVA